MKTVLITVFQSFISRSILGTDALGNLLQRKDIRVVLLVPDFKADYYREILAGRGNLIVEPVAKKVYGATSSSRLQRIAVWLLPTYFVRYNIEYYRERGLWSKYMLASFMNRVLAPVRAVRTVFRALNVRLTDTSGYIPFFTKYRPDVAFSPDVFHHADVHFLRAAKQIGVPTIGMVRSWDCTTNKNLLREVCDVMLVNNEQGKEELIRLHDVPRESISIVGFAQYDAYAKAQATPWDAFCSGAGLDPGKRVILFAPGGPQLTDRDWDYVQSMRNAVRDGALPSDVQILVRNHPQNPSDMSRFDDDSLVVVERPGVLQGGGYRGAEMDRAAVQHAFDSVSHCAIGVSVNTSFCLDLVIADKPHVMLAFDGSEKKPFLHSVARYHQEDNMKAFIETGAVRVARSPEDMMRLIVAYLEDARRDADERERARRETLWQLDGAAGRRIAGMIIASCNLN